MKLPAGLARYWRKAASREMEAVRAMTLDDEQEADRILDGMPPAQLVGFAFRLETLLGKCTDRFETSRRPADPWSEENTPA